MLPTRTGKTNSEEHLQHFLLCLNAFTASKSSALIKIPKLLPNSQSPLAGRWRFLQNCRISSDIFQLNTTSIDPYNIKNRKKLWSEKLAYAWRVSSVATRSQDSHWKSWWNCSQLLQESFTTLRSYLLNSSLRVNVPHNSSKKQNWDLMFLSLQIGFSGKLHRRFFRETSDYPAE